ncbi:MAG TPA: AraC family transcriptional regulator [Bacteroidales bacterium]|nr:AraC family transcriptional regulator [Bacteroidales bacterium]
MLFKNKINLCIVGLVLFIEVITYFVCFKKGPLAIFPLNNKFRVVFYTDKNDGGESVITSTQIADSVLKVSFVLKKGFIRPFIGLSILPAGMNYIDLSGYNQVKIEALGRNLVNMNFHIVSHYQGVKSNRLYCSSSFELDKAKNDYSLLLKNLKIPDWWYDTNNYSPSDTLKPDWKKVSEINFATGLAPDVDIERELSIYSVSFVRDNTWLLVYMFLILAGLILMLYIIEYFRSVVSENKHEVTIKYKPVEVANKLGFQNNYLDYINEHFQNPELSLEEISSKTGISQRKISEGIAAQFHCNVKTYINKIRISEAQRLLKETDLSISEIAFKTGFSSPSNFNRVFKAISGKNPTEFSRKKG